MGVYIPGMDMPAHCRYCRFLEGSYNDGLCHAASRWLDDDEYWTWYVYPEGDMDDSKPCNCPLVPVPKHGRLIDADDLLAMVKRAMEDDDMYEDDYRDVRDWLAVAPTIIEAEGGE